MIKITDTKLAERLRASEVTAEELGTYLLNNYPSAQIANELAGYLLEEMAFQNNKIILSPAQLQLVKIMFSRIARTRYLDKGRKPKNADTLAERKGIDETLFK